MGNIHCRVTNSTFGDSIMARIHRADNFSDFPVGELKADDYFKYLDQLPELDSDSDDDDKVDLPRKGRAQEDFPVPNIHNDEDEGWGVQLEKSAQAEAAVNDVKTAGQGTSYSTHMAIQHYSDQNKGEVPAAAQEQHDSCNITEEQNMLSLINTSSGCTHGNSNGSLILHNCHICVDKDDKLV